MPSIISVVILPNAPCAREMAIKAHSSGHEVLIHLSMAPLSKQSLGRDTLHPETSSGEIERITRDAISKVPSAVGLNNHMGNAMTSSLFGVQKVMQALECYDLYFLDSMTTGDSWVMRAALGAGVKVTKHKVFLDDMQNEADICRQFNRAAELARRNGSAIVIGHPHSSTVRILQQILYNLPASIMLVRPSSLLNEPQVDISKPDFTPPRSGTSDVSRNPFHRVKLCKPEQPLEPVYADCFFSVLDESTTQSTLAQCVRLQRQGWQ